MLPQVLARLLPLTLGGGTAGLHGAGTARGGDGRRSAMTRRQGSPHLTVRRNSPPESWWWETAEGRPWLTRLVGGASRTTPSRAARAQRDGRITQGEAYVQSQSCRGRRRWSH